MKVSVAVPVFNEAHNVEPLALAILSALDDRPDCEIIFVDDGSGDDTLSVLRSLHSKDRRIRYLSFSRNFGHQTALRAGLEASTGDCVIMMDGDFQHPPELIPQMLEKYSQGWDVVSMKRQEPGRGKPGRSGFLKRTTSRAFYSLVNALSDTRMEPGAADFRLVSARVRNILVSMRESDLFLRGAVPWTGFRAAEIRYVAGTRRSGKTKYTFGKMLSLALDGIASFSVKPLRLTAVAGFALSAAGLVYALYALAMRIFTSQTVEGWTSILASVLIIGGLQLVSLGILGEYLGKVFIQTKARPPYIVKESSSDELSPEKGREP